MDIYKSRLAQLFNLYLNNLTSEEELIEFFGMVTNIMNHSELAELIDYSFENLGIEDEGNNAETEKLYTLITQMDEPPLDLRNENHEGRVLRFGSWAVAASIGILFFFGLYWFTTENSQRVKPVPIARKEEIYPAKENTTLTLADGTRIPLDSSENGALAQQGNIKVIKLGDMVKYDIGDAQNGNSDPVYNTITTARGNQFQLILADGTKVWLNAMSSIRFPTSFHGKDRVVSISGEAYFDVATNARQPFKVNVLVDDHKTGELTVFGTEFNVNAYPDESKTKVTLLEGSIAVSTGGKNQKLKPGEQVMYLENGKMEVMDAVDIQEITAWKEGLFIFNGLGIDEIMKQIARWYEIDVEYEDTSHLSETFSGIVSRQTSLSGVLLILEKGGVKFKLKKRKIIIEN